MHLKGISQEMDGLIPTWKTVMKGRKRKKKKNEYASFHFYGWTSLEVSLSEA